MPAVDARIGRCSGYRWRGVALEPYRLESAGQWAQATRQVLLAGSRGAPAKFDVRYFEIEPGGCTSLERHRHVHFVLSLRGNGEVRTGKTWRRLGYLHCCYIGPNVTHQLRNRSDEPFGFLCIVDATRDRPVAVITSEKRRPRKRGRLPSKKRR